MITPIRDLPSKVGEKVAVLGIAKSIRSQKKFSFIELGYGVDQVQVIVQPDTIEGITEGSYIRIIGEVKKLPDKYHSTLPVEVACHSIQVLGRCESDLKSQCATDSGPEVKLAKRHFYFRDQRFALITRARGQLIQAIRDHFQSSHCTEIVPPSFTGVECEGGATLFKVQHPGKAHDKPMTAYLTQSSQFALEMMLPGVGDCFCIAPSFRAEHSHTRRHLTEFLHAESEWGGIVTFEDHLQKLRELVRGILTHFLRIGEVTLRELARHDYITSSGEKRKIDTFQRVMDLRKMADDQIVLTHQDAIKECRERGIYKDRESKTHFDERDDIPEAQERLLIDAIGKIVLLVKFPREFKSFYMALDPLDESRVLGCDVEVPGVGEIIGSGVREADYTRLQQRLLEQKLKPEDYAEYLDLRKYGFCQTSGMGLGVDRMLVWLLGVDSIRDVVTFPRFPGYLAP